MDLFYPYFYIPYSLIRAKELQLHWSVKDLFTIVWKFKTEGTCLFEVVNASLTLQTSCMLVVHLSNSAQNEQFPICKILVSSHNGLLRNLKFFGLNFRGLWRFYCVLGDTIFMDLWRFYCFLGGYNYVDIYLYMETFYRLCIFVVVWNLWVATEIEPRWI